MLNEILINIGLTGFVWALASKFDFREGFKHWAVTKPRIFTKLAQCDFCCWFWLSVAVSTLIGSLFGFTAHNILAPFVGSGLRYLHEAKA